jgi:uncharacterized protein (TIGR01777 family)
MKILISGASGLVGTALSSALQGMGHDVIPLKRGEKKPGTAWWDPEQGSVDLDAAPEIDAVFHLAGENIAGGKWTEARKARLMDSRRVGTRVLAEALAASGEKPGVLVSASGIGYYGDLGDSVATEQTPIGEGFLCDICREWEDATQPALDAGIRVVNARIGIVLSAAGGALTKMLTPFKLGLGGKVGSGKQYMSWVSLQDLVNMLTFVMTEKGISGPVNMVAPNAVTNTEFTKALGCSLKRPTIAPLPAFAARLMFGEMADELLLASTRVAPGVLQASGYEFLHKDIDAGMQAALGTA